MNQKISRSGLRMLALAASISLGIAGTGALWANSSANVEPITKSPVESQARNGALPQFGDIYEQVAPTVVSVRTLRALPTESPSPGNVPGNPPGNAPQGMGSGFVITEDGYILTNAHVVNDVSEVNVTLTDLREFKATVVGLDRRTDVALLKIDAKGLPVAKIGDPDKTRVGDWVAALGSPFGFTQTLTAGIVSAKSRSLPNDAYVPFIQTDAALNPGNSGGPLLNTQGEVIGISSQIYSPTGGYAGLSFAIPIDVAVKIKDELQKHGKVTRGRIGVVIQDMNKELAESFGLTAAKGALINSVDKKGPAATAGLTSGDIITGVNGKAIDNAAELSRAIGQMKPGDDVKLKVWRGGSAKEMSLRLDELPADRLASAETANSSTQKLGVMVRPTTPEEQQKIGETGGVVVEQSGGAAARAGIRQGDVILALNNSPVSTVDELKRLVDGAGKRAALLVQRDGARLYVPITLG
jgi:serine protease Do